MSYVFTLVALFVTTSMFAQEYKIPVENTKDGKLTLDDFMGDFTITGYEGKEIIITPEGSGGSEDATVPERAKGLKPIYGNGTDNTGIGIKMEKNGNQVTLTCLMPITKRREYNVKVPDNFSVKVKSDCVRARNITVQDLKNEVEIKTCQSITIKNVIGSMVLSTINGNIDVDKCGSGKDQTISLATVNGTVSVVFTEFSTTNPVSITTVNGGVDVTLPSKAAANIKMSTVSGTIYSDFEFANTEKKMKQIGGSQVNSAINGGGTELNLSTVNGNAYLRKGK